MDAGIEVAVGLAVLVAVAVVASLAGSLGHARGVMTASLRALLQLAALSLVLAAVLRSLGLTAAFLVVMVAVASVTSSRRISGTSGGMLPALDQTRTVGLVTLPGVFVGLLLGGATPLQAGVAQPLVLVALLAAEAMAAGLTVELVWRSCWDGARTTPSEPPPTRPRSTVSTRLRLAR